MSRSANGPDYPAKTDYNHRIARTSSRWRLGCLLLLFGVVRACPDILSTDEIYTCINGSYPSNILTPFLGLEQVIFGFMNTYPDLTAQTKLRTVKFSDITTPTFPANILPASVVVVSLSGIQLTAIDPNAFANLQLLVIHITATTITSLPDNLFRGLISKIDLISNQFTSFPANAFNSPIITVLDISDNNPPFTCIPPNIQYLQLVISETPYTYYTHTFDEFVCNATCSIPASICPNMVSGTTCPRVCPINTVSVSPFYCLNGVRTEAAPCTFSSCTVPPVANSIPNQCTDMPSGTSCSVQCNQGYVVYGYIYTCALGILTGSEFCASTSTTPQFSADEIPSVGQSDFPSYVSMAMVNRKMYVHQNNAPVYLHQPGTFMRICLVFGWGYGVTAFEHSPQCAAVTQDCRCYNWINSQSGTPCVDMLLNESVTLQWYLQPDTTAIALPRQAILQYRILKARWPHYNIHSFAAAHCALAPHNLRPINAILSHSIPVTVIVPSITLNGIEMVVWLSLFSYTAAMALLYLVSHEKTQDIHF